MFIAIAGLAAYILPFEDIITRTIAQKEKKKEKEALGFLD